MDTTHERQPPASVPTIEQPDRAVIRLGENRFFSVMAHSPERFTITLSVPRVVMVFHLDAAELRAFRALVEASTQLQPRD